MITHLFIISSVVQMYEFSDIHYQNKLTEDNSESSVSPNASQNQIDQQLCM